MPLFLLCLFFAFFSGCSTQKIKPSLTKQQITQKKADFAEQAQKIPFLENAALSHYLKNLYENIEQHPKEKTDFQIKLIKHSPCMNLALDNTILFCKAFFEKIPFENTLAALAALDIALLTTKTMEKLALECTKTPFECVFDVYQDKSQLKTLFSFALEVLYHSKYDGRGLISLCSVLQKEELISKKTEEFMINFIQQELRSYPPLHHPIIRSDVFLELKAKNEGSTL
jgi:hypothetical protein